jgi:hypothetical protein
MSLTIMIVAVVVGLLFLVLLAGGIGLIIWLATRKKEPPTAQAVPTVPAAAAAPPPPPAPAPPAPAPSAEPPAAPAEGAGAPQEQASPAAPEQPAAPPPPPPAGGTARAAVPTAAQVVAQPAPAPAPPRKKSKWPCCLGCFGALALVLLIAGGVVACIYWDQIGDLLFYKPPAQAEPEIDEGVQGTFEEFPLDDGFEVVNVTGVVADSDVSNAESAGRARPETRRLVRRRLEEVLPGKRLPRGVAKRDLTDGADVTLAVYRKKSEGYRRSPAAYRQPSRYSERFSGDPVYVCAGKTRTAAAARARVESLHAKTLQAERRYDSSTRSTSVRVTAADGKVYAGYKIISRRNVTVLVHRVNAGVFLVFKATRAMEKEVEKLARQCGRNRGLEGDPGTQESTRPLPSSLQPAGLTFLGLYARQIDQNYVEEKRGAQWAREMLGIWCTDAYYMDRQGRFIQVAYFNTKDVAKAVRVYDGLYSISRAASQDARKVKVKKRAGWYTDSGELNFRTGWFINAVKGHPKMSAEELRKIAELLQM